MANLVANIDLSRQVMTVSVNGSTYARWKVSTGRDGYGTPTGSFRPYLARRMHYSSKYENSPMPHSVFFRGGYAIHGTQYVRRLGRRASHGCVRLHPANAARLYKLVLIYGLDNTRIRIHW
ncbi:MAG: L,D-transpeptidase [Aestuariivirgaceae bacterium]